MTPSLTLSDLLTRRLHLQWYEGIAIVRGVAGRLLEHQRTDLRIPELHQIELVADGSVTLTGGVPANEPVRRLGQLLQALLTDAGVPVQMRLIVSQATAPIPSYSSLTEFDQALAYFERPDRVALLTALFARAEAAGPANGDNEEPTLDQMAPLPASEPTAALAHRRRNVRSLIATAAALFAAAVMSVAVALYARAADLTVTGPSVSHVTVAAADAIGAAVLAGLSAGTDRLGLGRIVPANTADTPPVPPAAPSIPESRMKSASSVAGRVESVQADAESDPLRPVVYELPEERTGVTEDLLHRADTLEHSSDAPIDSVVYAAGAIGVSPPVDVRPQLPRQLPPNIDPATLSRIELIISPDGSVESARLLGNRRDVQAGMLLSAVKAWRFRPATKDGAAVRYRKTVLVSFG